MPSIFRAIAGSKARDVHHLDAHHRCCCVQSGSTLVMRGHRQTPDVPSCAPRCIDFYTIMKIFPSVQGAVVGVIGTLIGVIGGVLLALNIDAIVPAIEAPQFRFLSPEDLFLSGLPSDLRWSDVWTTALIALGLALLATLYPSRRAWRESCRGTAL